MDLRILNAVIITLESISVRGREDCDKMAGCIKALESIAYNPVTKKSDDSEKTSNDTEGTDG